MGKFDKNPQLKDHFDQVSETVRKTAFSFIPAGPIFDSFWSYRSSLKQKRVIDFSESVKMAVEEIAGKELHASSFEAEDFIDLMELIYIKVMSTRSDFKLEKYKDILVRQIIQPETKDLLFLRYVQLIEELNEVQIMFMAEVIKNNFPLDVSGFVEKIKLSSDSIDDLITKYPPEDIDFYLTDLISRGLMREQEVSKDAIPEHSKEIMEVYQRVDVRKLNLSNTTIVYHPTAFGVKFLEFIKSAD